MKDLVLNKKIPLGYILVFSSAKAIAEQKTKQLFSKLKLKKFTIKVLDPCDEFNEGDIVARRFNIGNFGKYATVTFRNTDFNTVCVNDLKDFAKTLLNIISLDTEKNITFEYIKKEPTPTIDEEGQDVKYSLRTIPLDDDDEDSNISSPHHILFKGTSIPAYLVKKTEYHEEEEVEKEEEEINYSEDYDSESESILGKCLSYLQKPDTNKIHNNEADLVSKVEYNKKIYIDKITSIILDYVTRFNETPPMEMINEIVKGKLSISPKRPSKVVINNDLKIILPEYNEVEIRLTPLLRSIYILFLLHPEGIVLKHINDYHKEIEEIYLFIKPNGNDRLMKASIKDICNPVGDSLRQKLSKINRIIKSVVLNPQLADSYTINGDRGQKYNIEIAPNLRIYPNWLKDHSLFDI